VGVSENSLELQVGHLILELTLVGRPLGAECHNAIETLHFGLLLANVVHTVLLITLAPGVLDLLVLVELSDID
jgi:hypothetical protein